MSDFFKKESNYQVVEVLRLKEHFQCGAVSSLNLGYSC